MNKAQMNCKTEEHGLTTNVKGLNTYFYWKETGIPFGEWLDPVCEWVFFSLNWFVLILSDLCLTLIRLCFSFPYRFCSWFPRSSVSIPSMLSSLLKLSDTSLTAFSFGIFWIFKLNLTDLMNTKSGVVWCRFSEKISLYKITRPRYYFIFINFWLTFREVVPLAKMWKAINIEVVVKWTRLSKLENLPEMCL